MLILAKPHAPCDISTSASLAHESLSQAPARHRNVDISASG